MNTITLNMLKELLEVTRTKMHISGELMNSDCTFNSKTDEQTYLDSHDVYHDVYMLIAREEMRVEDSNIKAIKEGVYDKY